MLLSFTKICMQEEIASFNISMLRVLFCTRFSRGSQHSPSCFMNLWSARGGGDLHSKDNKFQKSVWKVKTDHVHFKTEVVQSFEDKRSQHFCSEEWWKYGIKNQDRGAEGCSGAKILRSFLLVEFLMFRTQSSLNHRGTSLSLLLGFR